MITDISKQRNSLLPSMDDVKEFQMGCNQVEEICIPITLEHIHATLLHLIETLIDNIRYQQEIIDLCAPVKSTSVESITDNYTLRFNGVVIPVPNRPNFVRRFLQWLFFGVKYAKITSL